MSEMQTRPMNGGAVSVANLRRPGSVLASTHFGRAAGLALIVLLALSPGSASAKPPQWISFLAIEGAAPAQERAHDDRGAGRAGMGIALGGGPPAMGARRAAADLRPIGSPAVRVIPVAGPAGMSSADTRDLHTRARRGDLDERATIACSQVEGQPLQTCEAGVARDGAGTAVIVVTFSNGFRRTLFFAEGTFLRGNTTMSGVGTDTASELADGVHLIRVDDQRFQIPRTLVMGR